MKRSKTGKDKIPKTVSLNDMKNATAVLSSGAAKVSTQNTFKFYNILD